ncbi:DUF192 domain-containing protein [archaeon]
MKVEWATTPWQKFLGLMFRKEVKKPLVLVLGKESRMGASIHMMFMRFPIDAVFLDTERKVVDTATLRPWALNYTPKKPAKYVVEMKAGTANHKLGATVKLE